MSQENTENTKIEEKGLENGNAAPQKEKEKEEERKPEKKESKKEKKEKLQKLDAGCLEKLKRLILENEMEIEQESLLSAENRTKY